MPDSFKRERMENSEKKSYTHEKVQLTLLMALCRILWVSKTVAILHINNFKKHTNITLVCIQQLTLPSLKINEAQEVQSKEPPYN